MVRVTGTQKSFPIVDWLILSGDRKPKVVPKEILIQLDPSIKAITDLPTGWRAKRESADSTWKREPNPDAD